MSCSADYAYLLGLARIGTRDNNSSHVSCVCKSPLHCFNISHVQCGTRPAHAQTHLLMTPRGKGQAELAGNLLGSNAMPK